MGSLLCFTLLLCQVGSTGVAEPGTLGLSLVQEAEAQLAARDYSRAQELARQALEEAADRSLQWRGRLVEVSAAHALRQLDLLQLWDAVDELEGWLAQPDLGGPELRIRTASTLASMLEGKERELWYRRALQIAAEHNQECPGKVAELLKTLAHQRYGVSGIAPAPPDATADLLGLDLGKEDREELWRQIKQYLFYHVVTQEEHDGKQRIFDFMVRHTHEVPPDSVLEQAIFLARSDDPRAIAMLEGLLGHPELTDEQLEHAEHCLGAITNPQPELSVSQAPGTFSVGQPVALVLRHRHIDQVELRITRLTLNPGYDEGPATSDEVVRAETIELSREVRETMHHTDALPIGLWRLGLRAGSAQAHRDIVVTDCSVLAWRDGESLELAVVDVETGRPVPGVPLHVGFPAQQEQELAGWHHEYRSDSHGRVSIDAPTEYRSRFPELALQRDGQWLPMLNIGSPARAVPESDRRSYCERSTARLQLLCEKCELRPGAPFSWTAIFSTFDDPECLPRSVLWTVYSSGSYEPVKSGTATVRRNGRLHGTFVPRRSWHEGDYEMQLSYSGQLASSWWRLGRLGTCPTETVTLRFSPLGTRATGSVRVEAVGSPGQQILLVVSKAEAGAQAVTIRGPLMAVGYHQYSRAVASRTLELGRAGTASLEIPWLEEASYGLVARAYEPGGSRCLLDEVAVTIRSSAPQLSAALHGRRHGIEDSETQPVLVEVREANRKPLQGARLRLRLRPSPQSSALESVPVETELPLLTDAQGKALVQVRADTDTSIELLDADGELLDRDSLRAWRQSSEVDLQHVAAQVVVPEMVDPGAETELSVYSSGEGILALLTVGDRAPFPLLLDQPVKTVPIHVPETQAAAVEIEFSTYSGGELSTWGYWSFLRRPFFDGIPYQRMTVERDQDSLVLSIDPPGLRGRALVLAGPIFWPPLPVELVRSHSVDTLAPVRSVVTACTMNHRLTKLSHRERTLYAAEPEADPPLELTITPAMVNPLRPARLLAERRLRSRGETVVLRDQHDAQPTAVVVLPADELSAPAFLVVDDNDDDNAAP